MKRNYFFVIVSWLSVFVMSAQNVGINSTGTTPNNSSILDMNTGNTFTGANGKGVIFPNVALTGNTDATTIGTGNVTGMMVYNTATVGAATSSTAVSPGFYYWNGAKWVPLAGGNGGNNWSLTGNAGTTAPSVAVGTALNNNFLGTTDNISLVFATNNLERMRINPVDGEVVVGATTSGLAGDMLCAVSNATIPWAINGYSAQNGGGVYGSITSGATVFAAVQGEYIGTHNQGAGVRGSTSRSTAGGGFLFSNAANVPNTGIQGTLNNNVQRSTGVFGGTGTNVGVRSCGVLGSEQFAACGGLGYYTSGGVSTSIYGFGIAVATGVAAGRYSAPVDVANPSVEYDQTTNQVGLGVYGGVMGGWIKGLVYGTNFSGPRYAAYHDGKVISNNVFATLTKTGNNNERVASYAVTSTHVEVTDKGKTKLVNGKAHVAFGESFKKILSADKDVLVNITPYGATNGLYVTNITADGFDVAENSHGTSSVDFSWSVSGTRIGFEDAVISEEVLSKEFDANMFKVMHNDNADDDALPIWWDGSQVRHDASPKKTINFDVNYLRTKPYSPEGGK